MQEHIAEAIGIVPMLLKLLEEMNDANFSSITMLLWTVWWRRNQMC
jgi:hypothetical protein